MRCVDGVLADPVPETLAIELAGSSVTVRARWWTDAHQKEVLRVRHQAVASIERKLGDAGIDLPFPTRVVLFHDRTEEMDGDRTQPSR